MVGDGRLERPAFGSGDLRDIFTIPYQPVTKSAYILPNLTFTFPLTYSKIPLN